MSDRTSQRRVAIVDYGMGNLYSVRHACEHVGLSASITRDRDELLGASAVILPGVGAFGVAMENLRALDLLAPLRDIAASPTPFVGICLGMQLLMTESQEFGLHRGLGVIEGQVVRLKETPVETRNVKVPQVGWNRIRQAPSRSNGGGAWPGTLLEGVADDEYMYFVHSFYCQPADDGATLSVTRYGAVEFASTIQHGSVAGVQFHPERSGPQGLRIYRNLAGWIDRYHGERQGAPEAGSPLRPA